MIPPGRACMIALHLLLAPTVASSQALRDG